MRLRTLLTKRDRTNKTTMKILFPVCLICLDVCAALVYAYYHDWKHAIYWLAAATLTICVTI